jgi:hypothetical protein
MNVLKCFCAIAVVSLLGCNEPAKACDAGVGVGVGFAPSCGLQMQAAVAYAPAPVVVQAAPVVSYGFSYSAVQAQQFVPSYGVGANVVVRQPRRVVVRQAPVVVRQPRRVVVRQPRRAVLAAPVVVGY